MTSIVDLNKNIPIRIERFFTRVNCSVRTSILYGDNVINCDTKTLSLQGMFLITDQLIPLNSAINVTVYHSSHSTINLSAKVVSTEPDGVCIKINRLSINSFAQLRDLIFEQSNNNVKVIQETLGMLKCINWN
jgi:hypothetical protein